MAAQKIRKKKKITKQKQLATQTYFRSQFSIPLY